MAEEPTNTDEQTSESERTADGRPKSDERIPYERLEQESKRAKKAEQELAELRNRILEFEDRDKSEVDRERTARQRAEQMIAELSGKVTSLEKGAWVRSAAAELDFHDPEDAVQHLRDQLGNLEDDREAKRLVKRLADNKKHLVRAQKAEERPGIRQMFMGDGVPAQQANGQSQQPKTPQQRAADRELEFAQGLSRQLNQFREGWQTFGSSF